MIVLYVNCYTRDMVEVSLSSQQTSWTVPVLYGAILVIIGLVLAAFKGEALKTLIMIAGALVLISGLMGTIVSFKESSQLPILSIVTVILGLVLILIPNFVGDVLMVLLGIGLILGGLLLVMDGVSAIKESLFTAILPIIAGVLLFVVGILAILNLDATKDYIMIIIGAVVAVAGLFFIFKGLKVRNVDITVN